MNIKFEDYRDLETVAIQLDNVLNLLSILGENVFCCNEFSLPPYMAQFVSVMMQQFTKFADNKKHY